MRPNEQLHPAVVTCGSMALRTAEEAAEANIELNCQLWEAFGLCWGLNEVQRVAHPPCHLHPPPARIPPLVPPSREPLEPDSSRTTASTNNKPGPQSTCHLSSSTVLLRREVKVIFSRVQCDCDSTGVAAKSETTSERGSSVQAARLPCRAATDRRLPLVVWNHAVADAGSAKGDKHVTTDPVTSSLQLRTEPEKSTDVLHAGESCFTQPASALSMLRTTGYCMTTPLRTQPVTLHIQTVQLAVSAGPLVLLIRSIQALLPKQEMQPTRIPQIDNGIVTCYWQEHVCCKLEQGRTVGCHHTQFLCLLSFNWACPHASPLQAQPWLVDCGTTENMVESTSML